MDQQLKMRAVPVTCKEFVDSYGVLGQELGWSVSQIANDLVALREFATMVHGEIEALIGNEWGEAFEGFLEKFEKQLKEDGCADGTIYKRRSQLKKIRAIYNSTCRQVALPHHFHDALRHLAKSQGWSVRSLGARVGVAPQTLQAWMKGKRAPRKRHVNVLRELDSVFSLSEGTLVGLVKGLKRDQTYQTCRTTYGKRISVLSRLPYAMKTFPERLEQDLRSYCEYKMSDLVPVNMERMDRWETKNGRCEAFGNFMEFAAQFYGFLTLPPSEDARLSGMGLPEDSLTIAMLGDAKLIRAFCNFRKARTGVFGSDYLSRLIIARSFVRKKGYLRYFPSLGQTLPEPIPPSSWKAWCKENEKQIAKLYRAATKEHTCEQARDVSEPIDWILDQQHPLHVLIKLTQDMEADLPWEGVSMVQQAVAFRDLLMVHCYTANPLRRTMMGMLTYIPDSKESNLYKKSDTTWGIHFKAKDFKNYRHAKRQDYDIELPEYLTYYIEKYLFEFRQYLAGGKDPNCHLVFLPNSSRNGIVKMLSGKSLNHIVMKLTQKFITDCPGCGPHAFRHIIATEYIKNNPDGFEIAAKILHDTVETVRRRYAHLKSGDYFDRWTQYQEEQRRIVNGEEVVLSFREKEATIEKLIWAMGGKTKAAKIQNLIDYLQKQLKVA